MLDHLIYGEWENDDSAKEEKKGAKIYFGSIERAPQALQTPRM